MIAICTGCGKECLWHACRGSRLSDDRSSCCNAPLKGKGAGKASAAAGKKYVDCSVCGRRTLHPAYPRNDFSIFADMFVRQAGTPVCPRHDVLPAGMSWGDYCQMPDRGQYDAGKFYRDKDGRLCPPTGESHVTEQDPGPST